MSLKTDNDINEQIRKSELTSPIKKQSILKLRRTEEEIDEFDIPGGGDFNLVEKQILKTLIVTVRSKKNLD